jgi:carboxymethylenebutenolidase
MWCPDGTTRKLSEEEVTLATGDGDCPCHVFTPGDGEPHPAVIMYMDGLGIRRTLLDMGRRLAAAGYVVLLPDLYYRAGPYTPLSPKEVFASGDIAAALGPLMASTDTRRASEDSLVFLDYLASRADVIGTKVGTTGYCLGGGISLTVAGSYPDRVAAAASFHGGRLVTDSDLSPSRVVPNITARVYVAGADHDEGYPVEMADSLEEMLTEAGVDHRLEVYPGARHGFTLSDFPVYDEAAAERHWRELLALLDSELTQAV